MNLSPDETVTVPRWLEYAAKAFEPPTPPKWATPGQLAKSMDPRVQQTAALDLIDEELVRAANTPNARLIISMPPQEGKSQRASRWFPQWVLTQRPDTRIAIVSYELGAARRWGRTIRDDITTHQTEYGLVVRADLAAQHEWELMRYKGGVYSAGIAGSLTGRPVDLMIIDDPVKDREQADSEVYRQRAWDWWTDVGSTRLAPGAPVVLILTRWHHDDLAGRLLKAEDGHLWRVVNIPAQADHDPSKGEEDPLGRVPGEFMESARGRTEDEWRAIKVRSGPRTWGSLYQGNPSPVDGGLFPSDWERYSIPLWVEREDGSFWVPVGGHEDTELAQSWDLTFKDTDGTDYVVGQVWLRQGSKVYLLDQVRARMSFLDTQQALLNLSARWPQAVAKFVEDKANGPAIINALSRTVPGIIPIEPEGSKYARASAISPFAWSRNIVLPTAELLPGVVYLTEEAQVFPHAKHDDTIDAMSQAVNRLLLMPLLSEEDGMLRGEDLLLENPHSYFGTY